MGFNVVEEFRKKTDDFFEKIDGYSAKEIENIAREFIHSLLEENDLDVEIVDVIISGSRCRGLENTDSDLDIVVEYKSDFLKEYALFNVLHDKDFFIGDIKVDLNPISKDDISGSLEEYLPHVEKYLVKKRATMDEELIKKADNLNVCYGVSPLVLGNQVSLPAEYDDVLDNKEQKRLVEIIKEGLLKNISSNAKVDVDIKIEDAKKKCVSTVSNNKIQDFIR